MSEIRTVDLYERRNGREPSQQAVTPGAAAGELPPPTVRQANAYLDRLRQQAVTLRKWWSR